MIERVIAITNRLSISIFGTDFSLIVEKDQLIIDGRIYLQVTYSAPCTKTGSIESWYGRKWYLSEFMTDDEIVKTAYCAFEAAVKHEIMEGFKVDGIILFNPHINFEELLKVSHMEIKRS